MENLQGDMHVFVLLYYIIMVESLLWTPARDGVKCPV